LRIATGFCFVNILLVGIVELRQLHTIRCCLPMGCFPIPVQSLR
jgi:hypothetical protein